MKFLTILLCKKWTATLHEIVFTLLHLEVKLNKLTVTIPGLGLIPMDSWIVINEQLVTSCEVVLTLQCVDALLLCFSCRQSIHRRHFLSRFFLSPPWLFSRHKKVPGIRQFLKWCCLHRRQSSRGMVPRCISIWSNLIVSRNYSYCTIKVLINDCYQITVGVNNPLNGCHRNPRDQREQRTGCFGLASWNDGITTVETRFMCDPINMFPL